MNSGVDIIGVGMHPFGRFADASLKDLARTAAVRALDDAGIGTVDIDAAYSSNALAGLLQGQEQIRGQTVLREIGIEGIPVTNVENACASGSTALREAVLAVRAGAARRVLVLGFEKMFVDDRGASLAALSSAADLDVVGGLGLQFTAVYAMRLREQMDAGKLTMDQLVQATVKSHWNGSLNPYAQFQDAVEPEAVLASRPIADPLTLLMCSAICDGAAAVIVAEAGTVAPEEGRPVIRIRASEAASGATYAIGDHGVARRTVDKAYAASGLGPSDVDVAEVHDAMAPGELLYYEELGFCAEGEAGALLETGQTSLSGSIAVNPSGGLTSRGHAIGATGIAQICELTWQLRGEAGDRQTPQPRIALAHNSGGWMEGDSAACNVHILERATPWT